VGRGEGEGTVWYKGAVPNYTSRERRRLSKPFALVLEPFSDIPPDQRATTRVLDLPAGTGTISWTLRSAGFDVTPCDIFPERFNEIYGKYRDWKVREAFADYTRDPASEKLGQKLWGDTDPPMPADMECELGDMEARLPYDDGAFDYVVSVEGIEHISDRIGTLREYRRVTRKGGKIIITTPNLLSLRARLALSLSGFRTFNAWLDEHSGVQGRSDDGARIYHGHAFMVDYNELRYCLYQAGFAVTRPLDMHDSRSSHQLKYLMYPFVWAATKRTCAMGKRKFERYRKSGKVPADAENPADEIRDHLLSPALLYGRVMGLEAVAI